MMHTGTYFQNQSPSNPLSQMKYIYLSIPVAADKTMYLLVWHNSSLFILLEKVTIPYCIIVIPPPTFWK